MNCPLCEETTISIFLENNKQKYFRCSTCHYLFLDQVNHLNIEEEKKIYDLHENDSSDSNYRKFLARLADPLIERIKNNSSGLDFGCGPGPTLSKILEERGHFLELYDKIYKTEDSVLNNKYDFVVMTEVIEHLANPAKTLTEVIKLIKKNGYLGIMTKFYNNKIDFDSWYYRKDPTHIGFYSKETFKWVAEKYSLDIVFYDNDNVIILST